MNDAAAVKALQACRWPLARLGEAIELLARRSGLPVQEVAASHAPADLSGPQLSAWIEAAAEWLGLETEQAGIPYPALERHLPESAPALVRVQGSGEVSFFAVVGGSRRKIRLLTPQGRVERHDATQVARFISAEAQATFAPAVDEVLSTLELPAARKERVRRAILREQLHARDFSDIWLLRPLPSTGFALQVGQAGLWRRVAMLVASHAAEYVCLILAWWVMGQASLQGRLDRGWMWAWALLLATTVPFAVLTTWLQGTIAIAAGAILKQRLLAGALRLDPDVVRQEGAGHLLGRTLESEAVESLALSAGFMASVAIVELVLAVFVLSSGATPFVEITALLAWTLVMLAIGWSCLRANGVWAQVRLRLTHELVERMIGHRTRLAQETPERWHRGEDEGIEQYLETSRTLDRRTAVLTAVAPRGWLLLAIAALAVPFVNGSASPAQLAITIGGALLAFRAFRRLAVGLGAVAEAWVSWRQVAPLFEAGGRREPPGVPDLVVGKDNASSADRPAAVVQAHELTFRYKTRATPVLKSASLNIHSGDRVILEGESGSGKSTLASLLVSMRTAESGLLLAGGLDRHTLGLEGWRRRIASAPQFHENHIITGTFAFNLLMSRPWPPTWDDVKQLEPLCAELGLDGVLKRMPGGVMQMVGESGWQLSHGERSRVFIARALLQDADLVVLDESFAALDPENLQRVLGCVRKRAKSLLVIAHR